MIRLERLCSFWIIAWLRPKDKWVDTVRFRDRSTPEDPPLRLTVGMYGTVGAYYEKPGEGGPEAVAPTTPAGRRPR